MSQVAMAGSRRRYSGGMENRILGRRHFLRGSLGLACLGLLSGCGVLPKPWQQPAKVPQIGCLVSGRSEPDAQDDGFRQGLSELGYVEGENLTIEWRFAERSDALPDLAAELVRLVARSYPDAHGLPTARV